MRVYDANTGALTASFYPGDSVGGQADVGWTDIPHAVHAYELPDGSYVVFSEDDGHGKVLVYSW
jgi:hypothetical protein